MKNASAKKPDRFRRWGTTALRWFHRCGVCLAWLWCVLAVFYCPFLPRWMGMLFALGIAVATVWALWQAQEYRRLQRFFWPSVLAVIVVWCLIPPTHQRAWSRLHAVMPTAEWTANYVTIRNVRKTVFGAGDRYAVEHYDDTFDLERLESVWLGVQHFAAWHGAAHTFLSFGFSDGRYLAISVESRRREGEDFSPLAGLFKQFGMIYVIGDEREVIGARALTGSNPIYLYPLKADRKGLEAMLRSMLQRVNQLAGHPEFYHTLTNNCTNNLVRSFNQIAPARLPTYSPRIVFPGYSDALAYDYGLIDTTETFEQAQACARINDSARDAMAADDFSLRIRGGDHRD